MRLALRTLRKNPVLTAVALLSLGIGIGANTAIFTLMDRLLLRAVAVRQPERLVLFASPGNISGFVETWYGSEVSFSWPKYLALRERSGRIFDGLLARFPSEVSVATEDRTEHTRGELVSGNYFDVLGVRPALGRLFRDDDTQASGGAPVAVLSYGYWTRRFGGDPGVLNRSLIVNGRPLTVVGVAQAGFPSVGTGEAPSVFVPITLLNQMRPEMAVLENAHGYWLNIFGRLKPGVARAAAESAMAAVWKGVLADDVGTAPASATPSFREQYLQKTLQLRDGAAGISSIRDDFSLPLYLLMGIVGLVLVIACANVANLLLARAAARSKEIVVRVSLGATRWRLVRHLMAESLLLSLGGGVVGIFIAMWSGSLLLRVLPAGLPVAGLDAAPDGRVLLFAVAVSVATGLLFGCVPALRCTRPDLASALKEQTATPTSSVHARFRRVLVSGQMTLSVILLATAGLFAHSLYNLQAVEPGFRTDQLVTFSIDPLLNGYSTARSAQLFDSLQRALAAIPGVSGVAMAKSALLTGEMSVIGFRVEGSGAAPQQNASLSRNVVSADFFRVMGIPLVAGREFRDSDTAGAPGVAVINQALAKKYFDGRNPIGLHFSRGRTTTYEIVGIVKDAKYDDLKEAPKPFAYFAAQQDTSPRRMAFYLRTSVGLEATAAAVREAVRGLDPNVPVEGPRLMRQQILDSVFLDRMVAALACAFAGLATVLAAIGLYGVLAWAVTQRRREIGIRMALGADAGVVMRMVLAEVCWLGGIGAAIAAPLWILMGETLKSLLYGVNAYDPLTLAGAVAVLTLVAGAAGWIPAFRAAHIDPISAIRYE